MHQGLAADAGVADGILRFFCFIKIQDAICRWNSCSFILNIDLVYAAAQWRYPHGHGHGHGHGRRGLNGTSGTGALFFGPAGTRPLPGHEIDEAPHPGGQIAFARADGQDGYCQRFKRGQNRLEPPIGNRILHRKAWEIGDPIPGIAASRTTSPLSSRGFLRPPADPATRQGSGRARKGHAGARRLRIRWGATGRSAAFVEAVAFGRDVAAKARFLPSSATGLYCHRTLRIIDFADDRISIISVGEIFCLPALLMPSRALAHRQGGR